MGKFVRIFIAIMVVLSFVVLARYEAAGAANPGNGSDQTSQGQAGLFAAPGKDDDDCNDKKNQDKGNCKCKNDKGQGNKDCGTVKPPKDKDKICKDESKSLGGVVVVKVKKIPDKDCVEASTEKHDPGADLLPPDSGSVVSEVLTLTVPSQKTNVQICFAAPPSNKQLKIFASSAGSWQAIKTNVDKGTACADVPSSGKFILLGQ